MSPAESRPALVEVRPAPALDDEPITLEPVFRLLRRYAAVIALTVALLLASYAGCVLLVRLLTTVEVGSVGIRFFFAGVEESEYPNGSPFSPQDLLAMPILEEVFEANALQRFMSFSDFERSLYIAPSNLPLTMLEAEYAAKLRDPKLSVAERRSLEEEFSARSASLRTASYRLSFEDGGAGSLPPALLEKVVLNIPAAWARSSVEKRHVLAYDVPLATSALTDDGVSDVYGYLLAAENLRTTTQALLKAVNSVAALPGANLVRDGRGGTIQDLAAQLAGYDHVAVNPIYHQILALAYAEDQSAIETVFGLRLSEYKRNVDLQKRRATNLDDAFERYVRMRDGGQAATTRAVREDGSQAEGAASGRFGGTAVVAQLGDEILTKLMRSTESVQDLQYRQRLNDEAMRGELDSVRAERELRFATDAFQRVRALSAEGRHDSAAATMQRLRDAVAALDGFTRRLDELYRTISEQNLNPESQLYRVETPFVLMKQSALGARAAALGGVGVGVLGFLVAFAVCALHNAKRKTVARRET